SVLNANLLSSSGYFLTFEFHTIKASREIILKITNQSQLLLYPANALYILKIRIMDAVTIKRKDKIDDTDVNKQRYRAWSQPHPVIFSEKKKIPTSSISTMSTMSSAASSEFSKTGITEAMTVISSAQKSKPNPGPKPKPTKTSEMRQKLNGAPFYDWPVWLDENWEDSPDAAEVFGH
uniref:Uncharacterized protein n=1 Tax=Strigamia maritima TaxID=126957 RepID=T1J961_STRMM